MVLYSLDPDDVLSNKEKHEIPANLKRYENEQNKAALATVVGFLQWLGGFLPKKTLKQLN